MHYRYDYTEARGWSFRRIEGGSDELLDRLRHASRLGLDPSPRDFPREAAVIGMESCLGGWLSWLRPKGEYALDIHYVTGAAAAGPDPFRMLRECGALPVARSEGVDWSALGALPGDSDRPIDIAPSLDYLGAAERLFVLEAAERSTPIRYYLSVTRSEQSGSAGTVGAWFHFDAETGIRRPEELWYRLQSAAAPRDALREVQPKPSAKPMQGSPPASPASAAQLTEAGRRGPDRAEDSAEDIEEVRRELARLREQALAEPTAAELARRLADLESALFVRPAPPTETPLLPPTEARVPQGAPAAAAGGWRAQAFPLFLAVALAGTTAWFQMQVRALGSRMEESVPYDRLEALEIEVQRRVLAEDMDRRLEGLVSVATVDLLRAEQARFVTTSELSQLRTDVAEAAPNQGVGRLEKKLDAVEDRVAELERAAGHDEPRPPEVRRKSGAASDSTEGGVK